MAFYGAELYALIPCAVETECQACQCEKVKIRSFREWGSREFPMTGRIAWGRPPNRSDMALPKSLWATLATLVYCLINGTRPSLSLKLLGILLFILIKSGLLFILDAVLFMSNNQLKIRQSHIYCHSSMPSLVDLAPVPCASW